MNNKNKNLPSYQILIISILTTILVILGFVSYQSTKTNTIKTITKEDVRVKPTTKTTPTPTVSPKPNPNLVSYKGEDGKNVLEILKKKVKVVTKSSSLGEYVDSINDIKGGTGGKYWLFYVNGKQAEVGAGAYVTKSTDLIEWKFE